MRVFNWIRADYGKQSRQLIFRPAGGRQIHDGKPHMYTGITPRMHFDHIHWQWRTAGSSKSGC